MLTSDSEEMVCKRSLSRPRCCCCLRSPSLTLSFSFSFSPSDWGPGPRDVVRRLSDNKIDRAEGFEGRNAGFAREFSNLISDNSTELARMFDGVSEKDGRESPVSTPGVAGRASASRG